MLSIIVGYNTVSTLVHLFLGLEQTGKGRNEPGNF
jgi:hypothetical protein